LVKFGNSRPAGTNPDVEKDFEATAGRLRGPGLRPADFFTDYMGHRPLQQAKGVAMDGPRVDIPSGISRSIPAPAGCTYGAGDLGSLHRPTTRDRDGRRETCSAPTANARRFFRNLFRIRLDRAWQLRRLPSAVSCESGSKQLVRIGPPPGFPGGEGSFIWRPFMIWRAEGLPRA